MVNMSFNGPRRGGREKGHGILIELVGTKNSSYGIRQKIAVLAASNFVRIAYSR